jgi:hypothetical protein
MAKQAKPKPGQAPKQQFGPGVKSSQPRVGGKQQRVPVKK